MLFETQETGEKFAARLTQTGTSVFIRDFAYSEPPWIPAGGEGNANGPDGGLPTLSAGTDPVG